MFNIDKMDNGHLLKSEERGCRKKKEENFQLFNMMLFDFIKEKKKV